VIFTATTHYLLLVYGRLHWRVLQDHIEEMSDPLRQQLGSLLGDLERYRLFGVFAVAFGIWAVCLRPRWVGIIALVISLFAVFEALIIT
jgi:hypothetical protein